MHTTNLSPSTSYAPFIEKLCCEQYLLWYSTYGYYGWENILIFTGVTKRTTFLHYHCRTCMIKTHKNVGVAAILIMSIHAWDEDSWVKKVPCPLCSKFLIARQVWCCAWAVPYIHTYIHTTYILYIHIVMYTYIHAYIHASMHTHTHAHTHHTYIHRAGQYHNFIPTIYRHLKHHDITKYHDILILILMRYSET